ncbi:hypothetical protein D9M72_619350 [compost metagenome]
MPVAQRSPEVRERVRLLLRQFRAEQAATSATATMPGEARSIERAAVLARMLDLPDTAEPTAEQRALRARLENDVAEAKALGSTIDFAGEAASHAA